MFKISSLIFSHSLYLVYPVIRDEAKIDAITIVAINSIIVKPLENLFIKKTPNNFGVFVLILY